MPKRSSKKKSRDINVLASQIVGEATKEQENQLNDKNPAAVALGKLGGLKGGKARAEKLTPERRSEIAKIAASARWRKKD
ncbi:MAG: hypothetical protein WBE46_08795 [Dehalococcoidia bacterium]